MKNPLILILLPLCSFCQKENLNKQLLKTSECYSFCASLPQIYQVIKEIGLADDMSSIYYVSDDGRQSYTYKGFIYSADNKTNAWQTGVVFDAEKNMRLCIVFDPHCPASGQIPKNAEAAIMYMKDGEVYDLDYGYFDKQKIPSTDNSYLEKITLMDGCSLIIKDRVWLKSIIIPKIKATFTLGHYNFTHLD